jgi:uncharacterized membrane protein YkvA (DUF1232 family)
MRQSSLNLAESNWESQSDPTYFKQRITWAKQRFATVLTEIQVLRRLVSHPCSGFSTKVIAACSVGYLFSPLQLIPSFIPVVGQLDDLFVVYIGMKLVRRLAPPEVLRECEDKALSAPFVLSVPGRVLKETA